MTLEDLRCEALRRAIDSTNVSANSDDAIVKRARAFYDFLSGKGSTQQAEEPQAEQRQP